MKNENGSCISSALRFIFCVNEYLHRFRLANISVAISGSDGSEGNFEGSFTYSFVVLNNDEAEAIEKNGSFRLIGPPFGESTERISVRPEKTVISFEAIQPESWKCTAMFNV